MFHAAYWFLPPQEKDYTNLYETYLFSEIIIGALNTISNEAGWKWFSQMKKQSLLKKLQHQDGLV